MIEIAISILVGIPIGVLTSFIAWWILFHHVVPVIRFSPHISKTETDDNKSGYRYRVKFENSGARNILDVELFARLRVKGFPPYPSNWKVIDIPLSRDRIPRIRPIKKSQSGSIIRLNLSKAEFNKAFYPEDIRQKSEEDSILLEDVMTLGADGTLQIIAFGYDGFSGARKVFESKPYNIDDIKLGPFDEKGLRVDEINEE